jgi:hypothetical protein
MNISNNMKSILIDKLMKSRNYRDMNRLENLWKKVKVIHITQTLIILIHITQILITLMRVKSDVKNKIFFHNH